MKTIYFMRHSNAGQTDKHLLNDHERSLTEKGEQLVPYLAQYFSDNYKDNPPQLVLSSTALRAKQTAELFRKNYNIVKNIEIIEYPELYITGSDEILNVIHNLDSKINSVLIISHNPGLHAFVIKFSREGDKHKFREMRSNFPPGSFAAFKINCNDWREIAADSGTLVDFVNAKRLKD